MCFGNNFQENKQHLKKSIARVMVYWVTQSRYDLLEELEANDPNKRWSGLALQEAFDNQEEWKAFFTKASDLFKEHADNEGFVFYKVPESLAPMLRELETKGAEKISVVEAGAERINHRVYGQDGGPEDWCPTIMPQCPDNTVINLMFKAAMEFVDRM